MPFLSKYEFQKLLFTLLSVAIGVLLPERFLVPVAVVNMLTIGIIHGANDLFILSKTIKTIKKRSFGYLFVSYVFFVLIMVLALQSVPQWALLLFILASAYHFGEQQWHASQIVNSIKRYLFYVFYGGFLFALLFYTHSSQTIAIVKDIADLALSFVFLEVLLVIAIILSLLLLVLNFNNLKSQFLFQFLALLTLIILFTQTSLLWSFSVYFIVWHSLPSLKEQAQELFPKKAYPITLYIRLALPYWILAMIGFGLALFFYRDNYSTVLSVFFSFLAAITIPHVFVIFKMYQKKEFT